MAAVEVAGDLSLLECGLRRPDTGRFVFASGSKELQVCPSVSDSQSAFCTAGVDILKALPNSKERLTIKVHFCENTNALNHSMVRIGPGYAASLCCPTTGQF